MSPEIVASYLKNILEYKPEEFSVHGYSDYDDTELLIEELLTNGVQVEPVLAFRHRGRSTLKQPSVELRVKLRLKYP